VARRKKNGLDGGAPVIGLLTIELHFPLARSLKEKRMAVNAIKDRLKGRFNAAVAETGYQELWQRSVVSAVTVGSEQRSLEGLLEAMARDVENRFESELVDLSIEFIG
jgi:uncharacterized protein YlxP (DUF503 family)